MQAWPYGYGHAPPAPFRTPGPCVSRMAAPTLCGQLTSRRRLTSQVIRSAEETAACAVPVADLKSFASALRLPELQAQVASDLLLVPALPFQFAQTLPSQPIPAEEGHSRSFPTCLEGNFTRTSMLFYTTLISTAALFAAVAFSHPFGASAGRRGHCTHRHGSSALAGARRDQGVRHAGLRVVGRLGRRRPLPRHGGRIPAPKASYRHGRRNGRLASGRNSSGGGRWGVQWI